MKVTISGAPDVMAQLQRVANRVPGAIEQALRVEAEAVMATAKQLVPVEVAALKGSGFVSPAVRDGNVVRVEMAFGGPAAPYAEIQHEDETLNHTGTHYSSRLRRMYTRTGQAKFLEAPLLDVAPRLASRLALRLKAALGLS